MLNLIQSNQQINTQTQSPLKPKKKLKQEYNFETKVTQFTKSSIKKIDDICNANNLIDNDYKLLKKIVAKLPNIDIPKNSSARKSFQNALNNIFKDKDRLTQNINTLFYYFKKMENGESVNKLVVNKSSLSIHKKKAYCVNFFKSIQVKSTNEKVNMVCQTTITRLQNSNDFTPTIYTDIKKGFLTEAEVINFAHLLVKDYKQVSSHVLIALAGNKNEMTEVIDKTVEKNINMNIVKTVVIPFIGSGSEYSNILPKIEGKNIKVIFSAYERTPYQLYLDIQNNRDELIEEIKKIEIEQVKFTKNSTTDTKYLDFNKLKLEELNLLEEEKKQGIRTSALFMFINPKGFGGNLEWSNGKTQLSFPKDMKKSIRSVSAKIEYFGYLMDKCDIIIENESFEVMMDKYDSKTTLFLLDPQYLKLYSKIIEGTKTTYGNANFPHELCVNMTTKLQGQFLYHNYKNYALMELMNQEHIGYIEHQKYIKNTNSTSSSYNTCIELIYHSKIENFIQTNSLVYEPLRIAS